MSISFDFAVSEIIRAGRRLDALGLAPATSGNYSMRLADGTLAVTVSGAHKGQLESHQVMRVSADGVPLEDKKPSDETLLHVGLYKIFPHIHAILHTHSVPCTVLTRYWRDLNWRRLILKDYELLKIFPNINTHETEVFIPIFENTQDMMKLQLDVDAEIKKYPATNAYLISGHGLYAWGTSMERTVHIVEALEFLLSCELETQKLIGVKR